MILSNDGLDFIKQNEGLYKNALGEIEAYKDATGTLTIGYGHTGNDVTENMTISLNMAESLLMQDTASAQNAVNRTVLTQLTQNAFDALTDFVYNVGEENFSRSTLLMLLNRGDYEEAADQFLRWDYSQGVELFGLENRREAEKALFLKG